MKVASVLTLVLVDQQEKDSLPLADVGIAIERIHLAAGDYSTPRLVGRAGIERKSQGDFFTTYTHDRARGERQLDKLCSLERRLLLVEADFADTLSGPMHPHSVIGSVASFIARRQVPVIFVGIRNRLATAKLVVGILRRWEEELLAPGVVV